SRKDIRLDLSAPAWLTFREAFNRGWRATCDGHDLGAPQPIDGYAMAWHVSKSCRAVDLAFAQNKAVLDAEIVSGLAVLGLVAILLAGAVKRRRREATAGDARVGAAEDAPAAAGEDAPARVPALIAAVVAVVLALGFGFLFAARATPLFAIALFVILYRGV